MQHCCHEMLLAQSCPAQSGESPKKEPEEPSPSPPSQPHPSSSDGKLQAMSKRTRRFPSEASFDIYRPKGQQFMTELMSISMLTELKKWQQVLDVLSVCVKTGITGKALIMDL